jgi:hypothetical protein
MLIYGSALAKQTLVAMNLTLLEIQRILFCMIGHL